MWLGFVVWFVRSSNTIKELLGNRPFRVREAVAADIPRHAIYRLRDEGALLTLSRGALQPVDRDPAMNTE
jgi:Transcriptional regulator, AbiEi antitoxin